MQLGFAVKVNFLAVARRKEKGVEIADIMCFAARKGSAELLLCILKEDGADVNAASRLCEGDTPLHRAAGRDHKGDDAAKFVRLLIGNGAKVDSRGKRGCTPLHVAASHGNGKTCAVLVEKGAGVNSTDVDKNTALHHAAMMGHVFVAEFLLSNGAEINARNGEGDTPLHLAAWHGKKETVEMLLSRGADKAAKNRHKVTPLDYAENASQETVAAIIRISNQKKGN